MLSDVIKEAKWNNYNNQILEPNNKIKTIWETVKLESDKKNINEEAQVLNIDGKCTNSTINHKCIEWIFPLTAWEKNLLMMVMVMIIMVRGIKIVIYIYIFQHIICWMLLQPLSKHKTEIYNEGNWKHH